MAAVDLAVVVAEIAKLRALIEQFAVKRMPPAEAPAVVGDGELLQLLGISADTYARRKKRGAFAFLQIKPQLHGHTQYSRALVTRWTDGEDLSAIGCSRFFAKARVAKRQPGKPGRPRRGEEGNRR